MSFAALMESLHDADNLEAKDVDASLVAKDDDAPAKKQTRLQKNKSTTIQSEQKESDNDVAKDVDAPANKRTRLCTKVSTTIQREQKEFDNPEDDDDDVVIIKEIKKSRRQLFAECLGVSMTTLMLLFTFQLPPVVFNILRWLTLHYGPPTQSLACIEWFSGVGEIVKAFIAAGSHPRKTKQFRHLDSSSGT